MAHAVAAEVLDGEVVRRWLRLAADALGQARSAIDALNVYPVPDADTGTNLHRTMVCAADAVAELPPRTSPSDVWQAAVSGALLGACGNSGLIVSQFLRGLADTCAFASPCDGQVVAGALINAAVLARAAVYSPAEGTLLTVADAAAQAACGITSLTEVARSAAIGARLALTKTELQLAVLAASGVVDAGAAGLCVVLDALSAAISGTAPGGYAVPEPATGRGLNPAQLAAAALAAAMVGVPAPSAAYEVTFALAAVGPAVTELRGRLAALGDSLVVSGGEPQWHVHVHVADPGAAIEAGMAAGQLSRITVTYLHGPATAAAGTEPLAGPAQPSSRPAEPRARDHCVVVAADGAGLARLLASAGAIVVEAPGETAGPSGVTPNEAPSTGRKITIVHNDSLVAAVAPAAGESAAGVPANELVIEIGCPVQALAAVAVHDPYRDLDVDAEAMRRAVAQMRYGGISPVAGSVAGLVGWIGTEEVFRSDDQAAVTAAVLDRLLAPGAELVTLLAGLAASPGLLELVASRVRLICPAAEVVCYDGGMTSPVLLIGVE